MDNGSLWIAGIGLLITFSTLLANVVYRTGHQTARIESLEEWRKDVRGDIHGIYETLEANTNAVNNLKTLIEERTERREHVRS